jgi:DNA transformation protein
LRARVAKRSHAPSRRATSEYRAFLTDLFSRFGPVEVRRTFNFAGLYHQGVIFGLAADERVFLKTDAESRKAFEKEGSGPMRYRARDGTDVAMSYYELPVRLYDDPDEAAEWAKIAFEVALRSPTTVRKRRSRVRKRPLT